MAIDRCLRLVVIWSHVPGRMANRYDPHYRATKTYVTVFMHRVQLEIRFLAPAVEFEKIIKAGLDDFTVCIVARRIDVEAPLVKKPEQ